MVRHSREMTDTRPHVADLGRLLNRDEHWAAAILGRVGVIPDEDGTFDAAEAAEALQQALFNAPPKEPSAERPDWLTAAEMGSNEDSCREWLISRLKEYGLDVVGRALRSGARMTLRRPDGSRVQIVTYVAMKEKPSGQIGFTVNHLANESYDWFAFVAKPLGKAFLRRRTEILASLKKRNPDEVTRASITMSAGTEDDLFENRIRELVEGVEPSNAEPT